MYGERGEGDGCLWTILGEVAAYETKLELLRALLHGQVYSAPQPGQPDHHHLSRACSLFFLNNVKGNMVTFDKDTLSVATMYLE